MNSMFSCFDAFCAEVMMGRTFKNSFPSLRDNPLPKTSDQQQSGKQSPPSPPATADGAAGKKKKVVTARFAPELDGLNCFETLVPS